MVFSESLGADYVGNWRCGAAMRTLCRDFETAFDGSGNEVHVYRKQTIDQSMTHALAQRRIVADQIIAMDCFDAWQQRKLEIADYYDLEFGAMNIVTRPHCPEWNAHKYAIMFDDKFKAQAQLAKLGVETEPHYPDILPQQGHWPGAEYFVKSSLSIPVNAHMTDDEVEQVVDTVEQVWKKRII